MEDMRIHARSRHQMEYQAHMETIAANKSDELDDLRSQINMLLADRLAPAAPASVVVAEPVAVSAPEKKTRKREWTPEQKEAQRERMAKVRAARKPKS